MDSTTLVSNSLTEDIIKRGAKLIEELDQMNLSVRAALWYYEPELDSWKFILGIEEVDREGPKQIYRIVQKALLQIAFTDLGIHLADVKVVSPSQRLIHVLRKFMKTGKRILRSRIRRNTIGDQYIEDALIYRVY